ncbi:alpha-amylase family protein [Cellulosimicrobium cellulans]|uniref:alpha-amylase n=1 Tax=Cellulosimicrobium cellulans TaxID=1710 RepID=UPI0030190DB6
MNDRPRPRPRPRHRRTRPVVGVVAVLAVTALAVGAGATACSAPDVERSRDVGVQLFQWTWDAISTECGERIGPAGYAFVVTSPPQEHVLGAQWWTSYQPVSHRVESRLGTRDEFAAMVDACHAAGVEVVADAVLNHMAGQDEPGTGWAGSPYEHYEYPGLFSDADGDFHHCDTPGGDISTYLLAEQVQGCELVNLADLATGSERVREAQRAYLDDLLSLGVDGFRIDAAKHVPPEDVAAIVAGLPEGTRVLQEVIRDGDQPVKPEQYTAAGQVYEFAYGKDLVGILDGGTFEFATSLGEGRLPDDDAVVFVENHDTERNGSTLTYRDGARDQLASVLMLATDYGTPVVYSGYAFTDRDAGPVQDAEGAVLDAACVGDEGPERSWEDGEWVCQHRWPAVEGLVDWRAVAGDAPLVDVQVPGDDVLAFSRGDRAFVAVNRAAEPVTVELRTGLPAGRYCDVGTGAPGLVGGSCTGDVVKVRRDGTARVEIGAVRAVALHVGARA